MTETADILRIIARDSTRLDSADRAAIAQAAEEFEQTQRALLLTQSALIESNARRIATNDALLEIKRRALKADPLSMSSGWVRVQQS